MGSTILMIDDDLKLQSLVKKYFQQFDLELISAEDSDSGIALFRKVQPLAIILDVMLPGRDGFETCKLIRKESDVPILMLTARGELSDRVVGLEIGADDYLPKPFEPRELVARVKALIRREYRPRSRTTHFQHNLDVDWDQQTASLNTKAIDLTSAEFQLLHVLARGEGKVFSRDALMESLRGLEWDAFNRSVDVLVSRLRQKLEDNPKNPKFIQTVWGSGYRWIARSVE